MRIVFAGTPETALPSLEALIASPHEVVAVVTRPDAPAGRGRGLRPSPVKLLADEHGIEVLSPVKATDPDFLSRLRELEPDCCPIVAYGALLRREVLDIPDFGWVNLHFSVLPAWRGAAPVQRSLMAGDEVTGATVFSLVEELDAGPVLGVVTERIRPDDTSGTLLDRLAHQGAGLLVDVLDHIGAGDAGAVAQPGEGVSYAHKLTTDDARVSWGHPAFVVDRQVRGCTPAPGAWTVMATDAGEVSLKIGPVTVLGDSSLAPGEVAFTKTEVRVGTATSDVVLSSVQPQSKKQMAAVDWARGLRVERATLT